MSSDDSDEEGDLSDYELADAEPNDPSGDGGDDPDEEARLKAWRKKAPRAELSPEEAEALRRDDRRRSAQDGRMRLRRGLLKRLNQVSRSRGRDPRALVTELIEDWLSGAKVTRSEIKAAREATALAEEDLRRRDADWDARYNALSRSFTALRRETDAACERWEFHAHELARVVEDLGCPADVEVDLADLGTRTTTNDKDDMEDP